jgi:hypothetical protein
MLSARAASCPTLGSCRGEYHTDRHGAGHAAHVNQIVAVHVFPFGDMHFLGGQVRGGQNGVLAEHRRLQTAKWVIAMTTDGFKGELAALGGKAGFGEAAFARRYEKRAGHPSAPAAPPAAPLTAGQHILHLLLTVLTGGLWGIVWIIRAVQGNKATR